MGQGGDAGSVIVWRLAGLAGAARDAGRDPGRGKPAIR
jgi:hypothetical protein